MRFKHLFLFLISISLSFAVKAEHIAGGDLDVQWISGNDFRVTLNMFFDCGSGSFADDTELTMTVREEGTNSLVQTFVMSRKQEQRLTLGDACFSPSSICLEEQIYTGIVTLPNRSEGYYFAWERCCRSPLNLNLIDDQAMVFYAKTPDPALRNSSPRFGAYPANGYMCVNEKNFFNFDVSDADGDSLAYSLITPLAGDRTSWNNPVSNSAGSKPYDPIVWQSPYSLSNIVGGTANMSIDAETGVITCSPTQTGAFTFAILVEEYRNGVKIGEIMRDIMFFALDCQKEVASVNQTPIDDDTALEGCIDARFIFELDQSLSVDTTICYDIKGSAINGVDYAFLDDCITIPAGQTTATIIIDAYADGLNEGVEDIYLIYNPIPCVDFVTDTVFLFIDDNISIDYELTGTNLTCNEDGSGQIDVDITGGFDPYIITVTPDSGNGSPSVDYSSDDLPITGLAAGTYLVEVDDIYGCAGAAEPVAGIYDAGATFLPDGNGNVYTTTINISGITNTTMTDPDEIQSVCLNMEHSFLGDLEMKLIAPDGTELILKERFNAADGNSCDLGEPIAKAPKDGGSSNTDPGIGWDYCFTPTPNYGTMVDESDDYTRNYTDPLGRTYNDNYLPSGAYTPYEAFSNLIGVPLNGDWTIWVKDHLPQDNGWIFNWSISLKSGGRPGEIITITEPDPIDVTLSGGVTQASCNGSDGAIDIDASGEFPPFDFSWSNGASTEDISGVSAGTYTVTVTDQNGCENEASFDVSNANGPTLSATINDEQCVASNDGSIDVSISTSGSITDISWSNGATTEDISSLSPGGYSVSVTDDSGCITAQTFTIEAAQPIYLSGTVFNEKCGNQDGEIEITAEGGTENYTYLWSNGETSEDISGLAQGDYTVTVTDDNGCSEQMTFEVINEVGQCTTNCDLTINSADIIDEVCGDGLGSINLAIYTSHTPYNVSWDNGMNGDNINNLSAGDYTATITDLESCEITQTFTVNNDAGDLAISGFSITDESCGGSNGAIDITVTGGDGNYDFSWSNGATSEDVSGLSGGGYTITVTDGTACSVEETFTVNNDTDFSISSSDVTDEVCSNGQGSINISVSPSGSYSYDWSNGETSQDISNLSAGTYSCVITDNDSGCQLTSPDYTVGNASGSLEVEVTRTIHEICGNSEGEIDIDISGGNPAYDVLWNTGATTEDLSSLSAGTYSAIVTDQNGCSTSTGNILIQNTSGDMSVFATPTDEVCSNGQGEIALSIVNATSPYDISWSNGETTNVITGLSSGSYTYTVTDANGCSVTASAFVDNAPGTLSLDGYVVTETECSSSDGAIDITVSGGDGNYNFTWSNGETNEDISNLSRGMYTVSVSDGQGCILSEDIEVPGLLTLSSTTITEDLCGQGTGAIDIQVSGGANYSYEWSNGETTEDISGLTAGFYAVQIESEEGCTLYQTFDVGNDPSCNEFCTDSYSTSPTGTVYDTGGEFGNYGDNEFCTYLIQPDCADSITLKFRAFSLENNVDFLSIYEGIDNTGNLLGTFTGFTLPDDITVASGAIYMQFSSDVSINYSGFAIDWTTAQSEGCFGAMCNADGSVEKSGYLADSGGEETNYGNNEECTYLIQPSCTEEISLSVLEFSTEAGDTLFIYDGVDETGELLATLSVASSENTFKAASGAMFLKFVSDEEGVDSGFKLQWSASAQTFSPSFSFNEAVILVYEPVYFIDETPQEATRWLWDFGDGSTSTQQNPTHIYEENDCFDVTLSVGNEDCMSSRTEVVCINLSTETGIYPNPSSGVYTLAVNTEEVDITIYNAIGELIDYNLTKVGDFKYTLNISDVSDGMYILKLNEEIHKLIKQN